MGFGDLQVCPMNVFLSLGSLVGDCPIPFPMMLLVLRLKSCWKAGHFGLWRLRSILEVVTWYILENLVKIEIKNWKHCFLSCPTLPAQETNRIIIPLWGTHAGKPTEASPSQFQVWSNAHGAVTLLLLGRLSKIWVGGKAQDARLPIAYFERLHTQNWCFDGHCCNSNSVAMPYVFYIDVIRVLSLWGPQPMGKW